MSRVNRAPERKVHGMAVQAGLILATVGDTSVTERTRPTLTWGDTDPPTHSEVNGSLYYCTAAAAAGNPWYRRITGAWVKDSITLDDLYMASAGSVTISGAGKATFTGGANVIQGATNPDDLSDIGGIADGYPALMIAGTGVTNLVDSATLATPRNATIALAEGDRVLFVRSGTVHYAIPLWVQAGVPTSAVAQATTVAVSTDTTGATVANSTDVTGATVANSTDVTGATAAGANTGSNTTGITAAGAATSSDTTGITAAGADTGAAGTGSVTGSTGADGTGATGGDNTRDLIHLGALAAGGVAYHAAYNGGAGAIDDAAGPWTAFLPTRTVEILGNGALLATVWTIDMVDPGGTAIQDVINHPGGAVTAPGVLAGRITRVRSNIDPGAGATATLSSGGGFSAGVQFSTVEVSVDGVVEAPISSDGPTGTVVPTSAPNAARVYVVSTGRTHTHTGPSHSHAAGTLAGPSHQHTAGAITVTDTGHDHTAGAITVTDTGHSHTAGAITVTDTGHDHTAGAITVTDTGHTHTATVTDAGHTHTATVTDAGHTHTATVTDAGHTHTATPTNPTHVHNS